MEEDICPVFPDYINKEKSNSIKKITKLKHRQQAWSKHKTSEGLIYVQEEPQPSVSM